MKTVRSAVSLENISKILCGVLIAALVLVSVSVEGCQLTPEGITILGGDYSLPAYLSYEALDSRSLVLKFSGEVALSDIHVAQVDATLEEFAASPAGVAVPLEERGHYCVTVDEPLEKGVEYVLAAVATDNWGNTVHFSATVHGYNENPAKLVLSEVRTEYSKPKVEFVELFVLAGGNLAGMVLESVCGKTAVRYVFPAVDVKAGEYVVVHFRKLTEDCVDELGDDLAACTNKDAAKFGRDLWVDSTKKGISATGVILLRERDRGRLLDALCYAESTKEGWPYTAMGDAAQEAFAAGIWVSGTMVVDAVCADGLTSTRTLSRQELESLAEQFAGAHAAGDTTNGGGAAPEYPVPVLGDEWFVVATSKATPGAPNSNVPYE